MGILDNNLVRTQGREKNGILFTNLSGVSPYTANKIDCRGFNSLVLILSAYTNPVDVLIVGFYPDQNTTINTKLYGIDITTNLTSRAKKEIVSVPIYKTNRYVYDVSMFDYVGIGKTVDNSNTLTCGYQLFQSSIDFPENYTNTDLTLLFENDKSLVYKNTNSRKLVGTLRNIVVWSDQSSISLSQDGFNVLS